MVEWSYYVRPKNSSPHCVLLGGTDDGSFTKAAEISPVRLALASLKAQLTDNKGHYHGTRLSSVSRHEGVLEGGSTHQSKRHY